MSKQSLFFSAEGIVCFSLRLHLSCIKAFESRSCGTPSGTGRSLKTSVTPQCIIHAPPCVIHRPDYRVQSHIKMHYCSRRSRKQPFNAVSRRCFTSKREQRTFPMIQLSIFAHVKCSCAGLSFSSFDIRIAVLSGSSSFPGRRFFVSARQNF